MKILVKEFQEKPFEVPASNRNVQKSLKIQISMNEADDIAGKEALEIFKIRKANLDEMKAFVVETLRLNPKQVEKYDGLDVYSQIPVIAGHISGRLLGVPEEEYQKSVEQADKIKK
ncbi:putative phage tail protein [Oenococcus oeni]|uniref:phage tail tube assembly chaperone n=1 Tax=Oenococcus oeni TaxID=1247 RepID=UPI001078BBB3|nr:phage tail tube assembly chaperone [Oenococcus oeni]AVI94108.1 hypothetical protein AX764_04345 [Oenococcus oeni]SYV99692.1 putative phage tail protein [Oenococcus oeni]SYW03870.1 putative phage tail protein [Oenococcus oeni]SYW17648.1 putative phage tail protein [Oenococcus oeni]VDC14627.1 putative phage tail protein [Oenococcus oeni]